LQEQGLSLPDLDILKPSEDVRGRLPGWNIPATTTFSASPGKISLFPQKQAVVEECEKILLPPGPSESRRQQTNEPVCPQEFCPEELDDLAMGADSAAPGLEGFDYLLDEEDVNVLPVLSAADVEAALPGAIKGDSEDVFAPSVPSYSLQTCRCRRRSRCFTNSSATFYTGEPRTRSFSTLRTAIFFCEEDGKRADPGQPRQYFRVADFSAVSEVWKRIKCNSSSDCTKNMKRAMRMSTTNDRHYFINLSQKLHRMQVFRFGERSLEHFKKVFPTAYQ
uniref:DDE_Tnp_1_7 domain-containing protein n=1 Tax=Macrostomum lignano TaxID=282301 RepID=A0A1I8IYP0_9PLAT